MYRTLLEDVTELLLQIYYNAGSMSLLICQGFFQGPPNRIRFSKLEEIGYKLLKTSKRHPRVECAWFIQASCVSARPLLLQQAFACWRQVYGVNTFIVVFRDRDCHCHCHYTIVTDHKVGDGVDVAVYCFNSWLTGSQPLQNLKLFVCRYGLIVTFNTTFKFCPNLAETKLIPE